MSRVAARSRWFLGSRFLGLGLLALVTPIAVAGGILDFHPEDSHVLVAGCLFLIGIAVVTLPVVWARNRQRISTVGRGRRGPEGFRSPLLLPLARATGPPLLALLQVSQR